MSLKHTLYISSEANGKGTYSVFQVLTVKGLNPSDCEMHFKTNLGLLKKKPDGQGMKVIKLVEAVKGLALTFESATPGGILTVALGTDLRYYLADETAPLFDSWHELNKQQKCDIGQRLLTQADPFRQELLNTLLGLPVEQIVEVFDSGMDQENHLLMALAVQALPEDVLEDMDLAQHLSSDIKNVFARYEKDRSCPIDMAEMTYPYFYAIEKLKTGVTDCHVSAIIKDFEYYFNSHRDESIDHDVALADKHYMFKMRYGRGYDNNGMTLAMVAGLVLEGKPEDALVHLIRYFELSQDEERNMLDSLMYGYADYDRLKGKDSLDLAIDLLGKETIANILIKNLTCIRSEAWTIDTETQIAFFNRLDQEMLMSTLRSAVSNTDKLSDTKLSAFMLNLSMTHSDQYALRTELLKLHIEHYFELGDCGVHKHLTRSTIESDVRDAYSTRIAIETAMKYTTSIISATEPLDVNESNPCINQIFQHAITHDVGKRGTSYSPAKTAVCFLALSGTRYPDLLQQLDQPSAKHLIDLMDKLGVEYNRLEMAKLLPIAKAHLLESAMNL